MAAMLEMKKIDIETLERAAEQVPANSRVRCANTARAFAAR